MIPSILQGLSQKPGSTLSRTIGNEADALETKGFNAYADSMNPVATPARRQPAFRTQDLILGLLPALLGGGQQYVADYLKGKFGAADQLTQEDQAKAQEEQKRRMMMGQLENSFYGQKADRLRQGQEQSANRYERQLDRDFNAKILEDKQAEARDIKNRQILNSIWESGTAKGKPLSAIRAQLSALNIPLTPELEVLAKDYERERVRDSIGKSITAKGVGTDPEKKDYTTQYNELIRQAALAGDAELYNSLVAERDEAKKVYGKFQSGRKENLDAIVKKNLGAIELQEASKAWREAATKKINMVMEEMPVRLRATLANYASQAAARSASTMIQAGNLEERKRSGNIRLFLAGQVKDPFQAKRLVLDLALKGAGAEKKEIIALNGGEVPVKGTPLYDRWLDANDSATATMDAIKSMEAQATAGGDVGPADPFELMRKFEAQQKGGAPLSGPIGNVPATTTPAPKTKRKFTLK